jgi:hypothetical protein
LTLFHTKLEFTPDVLLKVPKVYFAAVGVAVANCALLKAKINIKTPLTVIVWADREVITILTLVELRKLQVTYNPMS